MAKISGVAGQCLAVHGYNLSGDAGAIDTCSGGHSVSDTTGIDKSAVERLALLRDGNLSYSAWWDTAALSMYAAISTLPTTDRIVSWGLGVARGDRAACMTAKQVDFAVSRGADGGLGAKINCVANAFGLDWGYQLSTGVQTITSAANGTGVDLVDVSSDFGAIAYLHVMSVTGTSVTFHIEDSADNIDFEDIEGVAFAAVTAAAAPTAQRVVSTLTTTNVRRYVRLVSAGTFTAATFHLAFIRPLAALS